MIDYRLLLLKYIRHVGECEGTTFLFDRDEEIFDPEEWLLLEMLDRESTVPELLSTKESAVVLSEQGPVKVQGEGRTIKLPLNIYFILGDGKVVHQPVTEVIVSEGDTLNIPVRLA